MGPEGQAALAVGAVLTVLGAVAAPFAAQLLRSIPLRVPVFFARWGFSHALLLVLLVLFSGMLAGPLVVTDGEDPGVLSKLYLTMATLGVGVVYVMSLAKKLHPEGLGALGLARDGNLRGSLAGSLSYLLVLPGVLGIGLLWPVAADFLGFEVGPQEVLTEIRGLSGFALGQAIFLAVFVGPFLEETIFRGFLQPLLVQNLRELGGIAVTSSLFAALHGGAAFGPLFALSMLLGYTQLRTQRLIAPWFVHGLHNAVTLGVVLLWPEWYASLETTS